MSKCNYKKGLLSLRDCGAPVSATCSQCKRPVCDKHSRFGAQGSSLCLECHAQGAGGGTGTAGAGNVAGAPGAAGDDDFISHRRRHIYRSGGYYPFYFGHRHRYGHEDYRHFDSDHQTGEPGAGPIEDEGLAMDDAMDMDDDMDASDFQDS